LVLFWWQFGVKHNWGFFVGKKGVFWVLAFILG